MQRGRQFTRIRTALAASAHFQALTAAQLDRLAGLARVRHLRHAERIAEEADDRLFVILSGAVRLSSHTHRKEFVYAVLGAGSYFGLANAVRRAVLTAEARAFGATELAMFSSDGLIVLLDEQPRLWRHVTMLLARRLRIAFSILRDNSVAPLQERIVRRLLGHALSSSPREDAQPVVRMTQADLALMLGASRSKTNAALKRMEAQGLLRSGYRGIVLLDIAGLRALSRTPVRAY